MLNENYKATLWEEAGRHNESLADRILHFARAIERAARKEAFEECAKEIRRFADGFPTSECLGYPTYVSDFDTLVDWAEAKAKEAA